MENGKDNNKHLHCRLCDWKTLRFKRRKDGRAISGWGRLDNHFSQAHEKEYFKIHDRLDEEFREKERIH